MNLLKGKNVGIVTNQTRRQANVSFTIIKFDKFNTIITADKVKRAKPHPESLKLALKRLKLKKDEVIFIGDTRNDYKAGKAAGIETYLLEHKYNRHIRSKKIRSLKQVVKMVL